MTYNKTIFVNDSTPPISAENLNNMEDGISKSDMYSEDGSQRLKNIDGGLFLDADKFELGNISIGNAGWTYSTSTSRVRTKQSVTFSLNVGDIIRLKDYTDARFYIGWLTDGTYYSGGSWKTTDFKVTQAGNYVILLSNRTEVSQNVNKYPLLNLLEIVTTTSLVKEVSTINNNIASIESELDETITYENTVNLLDPAKLKIGYRRRSGSPTVLEQDASYVTWDFLPVLPNKIQYLSKGNLTAQAGNPTIVWDANQNFIKTISNGEILPYGAAFVSITLGLAVYNANPKLQYELQNMTLYQAYYNSYYEIIGDRQPFVDSLAHQGYNLYAPNQCMAAYKAALKYGFNIVECDINYTSDGEYICCHNGTVFADTTHMRINPTLSSASGDYTTPIVVNETSLSTLESYSWGYWKSPDYESETVLLFKDLLKFCKMNGLKLYIDDFYRVVSDASMLSEVLEMIDLYGMADNVILTSLNVALPAWKKDAVVSNSVGTYTQTILDQSIAYMQSYPDTKMIISIPYEQVTDAIATAIHQAGIKLYVWTVDDYNAIYNLIPTVDGVFSNNYKVLDALKRKV